MTGLTVVLIGTNCRSLRGKLQGTKGEPEDKWCRPMGYDLALGMDHDTSLSHFNKIFKEKCEKLALDHTYGVLHMC